MTPSIDTTLLALLLALSNLDAPLTDAEKDALNTTGEQLDANLKAWNTIEKGLMKAIEANHSLHQQYQAARTLLQAVDRNIPRELLPTEAELEEVLGISTILEKRPYKPKLSDDSQSDAILSMSIKVLNTPNPEKTTKKITRLEKLLQFLKPPANP